MPTYLKVLPSIDVVFKSLVTGNMPLLQGILQGALPDLPPEELENPQILNPTRTVQRYDEKVASVDVKLKTKTCKLIAMEMQKRKETYLETRTVYTLCDLIASQVKQGDKAYNLQDSIVIVICDFVWDDSLEGYHQIAKLRYETGKVFTDKLSIHLLELPKLPAQSDGTSLWHYLKFFKSRTKEDFEMLTTTIPGVEKALEDLENLQADEELQEFLRAREREILTRNTELLLATEKGLEQGLEQGLAQGLAQGAEKTKLEAVDALLDILDDTTISEKLKVDLPTVQERRRLSAR